MIKGFFVVDNSKLLAYDISAIDLQMELQLLDKGQLSVSRSAATSVGGYTWSVTYLTALGNQPPLVFVNLLTGSGTMVSGTTVQNGNYLNGSYVLNYNGFLTASIPFDATAVAIQTALAPIVGLTVVTKVSMKDIIYADLHVF